MTMELTTIWFILIAVLWIGYFVLEGFDFGVGTLLPVLGRANPDDPDRESGETRKRQMLSSIGPFWDGNEVWLITAGGATFAAFPHWYATLFSGFYLPLLLILVALIVRNLGFEYRGKGATDQWRRNWDYAIIFGSFLPALLWGVAFANIVNGTPIDAEMEYAGNLFTLLNPLALLGGLTTTFLFLTHGAIFVSLKTDGSIRADARLLATKAGLVTAVLAVVFLGWTNRNTGNLFSWVLTGLAAVALLAAIGLNVQGREGMAFLGTTLTTLFAVSSLFFALFPDVMPSTLDPEWSLTAAQAASSHYTLVIMTWAAVIFVPIVLAYQGWTYWVFRKRLTTAHIPEQAATY